MPHVLQEPRPLGFEFLQIVALDGKTLEICDFEHVVDVAEPHAMHN